MIAWVALTGKSSTQQRFSNGLKLANASNIGYNAFMQLHRRWFLFCILAGLIPLLLSCRNTSQANTNIPFGTSVLPTTSLQPGDLPNPANPPATQTSTPGVTPTPTVTQIAERTPTQTRPNPTSTQSPIPTERPLLFAVIGDYGQAGTAEAEVARMVLSWQPDLIITTGDNNYPDGKVNTIDENIGQFYHSYIYPYLGSYGEGAETNRFFPSLGNHDWHARDAQPYQDYFTLPGNERYYTFSWGPVDFFSVDSVTTEPDGVGRSSDQGAWLQQALDSSTATWKIVYTHYPPYSSAYHGSTDWIQWPFTAWGADAVLAGHDHTYERLMVDGIPYFVNGLGGAGIYKFFFIHPGSQVRFNGSHGAMWVEATKEQITFRFYAVPDILIDSFQLVKSGTD